MAALFTPRLYQAGESADYPAGTSWTARQQFNAKAVPKAGPWWQRFVPPPPVRLNGLIPYPVHKAWADTNSPPDGFKGYFDGQLDAQAFPSYQEVMHEVSHQYFPFYPQQQVELAEVWLWDDNGSATGNGQRPIEIEVLPVGKTAWASIGFFTGEKWKDWLVLKVPVGISTQLPRFKLRGTKGPSGGYTSYHPNQVRFYGRHTLYQRPEIDLTGRSLVAQCLVNTYRYGFAPETINPLGGTRLYYNSNYIRQAGETGWRFEELGLYLRQSAAAGKPVLPMFMECPVELARTYPGYQDQADGTPGNTNYAPCAYGADREQPETWRLHGEMAFQLSAWGGINKNIDPKLVRQMATALHPDWGQGPPVVEVGTGVLRMFGTVNEPDQTWHGEAGNLRPAELAMLCSVRWDGHKGLLGPGVGAKAADPSMKLALGIYKADYRLLQGLGYFWEQTRGRTPDGYIDSPVHLFDCHGYNSRGKVLSNGEPDPADPPMGEAPELVDTEYIEFVRTVKELFGADKLTGRTEYGYSLGRKSVQRVEPTVLRTREQVQGEMLVRDAIGCMLNGFDLSACYQLGDDAEATRNPDHTDSDKACGIWGRPAWAYLAQVVALADGYTGAGLVQNAERDPGKAYVAKLVKPGAPDLYAAWMGVRGDASAAFALALTGTTATRLTLQDEGQQAKAEIVRLTNGKLTDWTTGLPTFFYARPT